MGNSVRSRHLRALHDRDLTRRDFVRRATAVGIPVSLASTLAESTLAQPVSSPAATPKSPGSHSLTRHDYLAAVRREFNFGPPRSHGGHVLHAMEGDIGSLNPIVANDGFSAFVNVYLFSAIVNRSVIDGTWVPDLADFWEVSEDSMTYTFHLNHDVTWHDGVPLTAHDCVFTLDAVLDERSLSYVRSDVASVVERYQAIDNHTFELVARLPTAIFLDKSIGSLAIMPKHIWESIPVEEWGAGPGASSGDRSTVVGSGPFRFEEWVRGDHVSVVRNDNYFVPELVPILDRVTWRVLADSAATVQSVIVGETDICQVPAAQLKSLQASNPEFTYRIYDDMEWVNFTMNGDPELGAFFSDRRVRQAMMFALDRDLIIEEVLQGQGNRADGVYPPPSHAYAPDRVTTNYTYDPDRARALLDEAGWVEQGVGGIREKDGVRFKTDFLYSDAGPYSRQIVTYLQQAWREVGIDIETSVTPFPELIERASEGDYQLSIAGWNWVSDDLGLLYRCDAVPPGGFNFSRICNPEFDRLNTESVFELDPRKRRELLIAQGNIANDDAHLGLLFFSKSAYTARPRVRNFFANAYGRTWSLPRMWVTDDG